MDDLGIRMRILRKHLKLSREAFGMQVGVSRDVIANIELGRLADITQKEPLLKLICDKYGANYDWLMYGQGEMLSKGRDINPYVAKIIETYLNLEDSKRSVVDEWFMDIAEALAKVSHTTSLKVLDLLDGPLVDKWKEEPIPKKINPKV